MEFEYFTGMTGDYLMPEIVGGGVAIVDVDRDGDLDLFFVQGAQLRGEPRDLLRPQSLPPRDRLYLNQLAETGTLRFVDATEASGIFGDGYGIGVTSGDVDGDGLPDLYVTELGGNRLWRNLGGGRFEDWTERSGVQDERWSVPAVFFDYDGDEVLDLYVGNYVHYEPARDKTCRTATGVRDYCGPFSYEPAGDRLLRGRGDGTFEDVTEAAGLGLEGSTLGAVAFDADGDLDLDLYVANDGMANHLWINQGDGTFLEEASFAGVALNHLGRVEAGMGVVAADLDRDGVQDLFLTHLEGESHTYYRGAPGAVFEDRTRAAGLEVPTRPFTGFGVVTVDLEHDGWLDLVAVHGAVHVPAGADASDVFPLAQRNVAFRGAAGRFEEVPPSRLGPAFAHQRVSRGLAAGDLDGDGALDLVVVNAESRAEILLAQPRSDARWVGVDLGGDVSHAAEVRLSTARSVLDHAVNPGGSYASFSDPRILVGLGEDAAERVQVDVRWRSGTVESWDVPARATTRLKRGTGRAGRGPWQHTRRVPRPGDVAPPERTLAAVPGSPEETEAARPGDEELVQQVAALPSPSLGGAEPAVREQLLEVTRRLRAELERSPLERQAVLDLVWERASLHVAYSHHEEAQAALAWLADQEPGRAEVHYLLGFSLHEVGQSARAEAPLERAAALPGVPAAAPLRLGRVRLELGRPEEAVRAFRQALDLDGTCAAARYGVAVERLEAGDVGAAVLELERALELRPGLAQAQYALGMALRRLGRETEARQLLEKVMDTDTSSSMAWWGCEDPVLAEVRGRAVGSGVHLLRATLARARGDLEVELDELAGAVAARPDDAGLRASHGARLLQVGRAAAAAEEFAAAAALEPGNATHPFDRGEALRSAGRLAEADAAYRKAWGLDPTLAVAAERIGGLAFAQRRFDEAASLLEEAVRLRPDRASARLPLALALVQLRRNADAVRELDLALQGVLEVSPEERLRLVEMLLVLGGVDQSLRHFAPYLEDESEPAFSARAHYWVGSVWLGRGERQRARGLLERALALDPQLEPARAMLEQAQ